MSVFFRFLLYQKEVRFFANVFPLYIKLNSILNILKIIYVSIELANCTNPDWLARSKPGYDMSFNIGLDKKKTYILLEFKIRSPNHTFYRIYRMTHFIASNMESWKSHLKKRIQSSVKSVEYLILFQIFCIWLFWGCFFLSFPSGF